MNDSDNMQQSPSKVGRFLCRLGFHDYRVVEKTFQFGAGSGVEKVECRRCGLIVTRQG
jgi:hypothetical protein